MTAAKRSPKRAGADDPGQYLPLLAVTAANRVRMPTKPLTRSEALASAPWDAGSMPAAWEAAFRRAYADRLEELGAASPARRGGASGPSLSESEWRDRGVGTIKLRLPQPVLDKLDRDAKRIGCSRAKLVESLILGAES